MYISKEFLSDTDAADHSENHWATDWREVLLRVIQTQVTDEFVITVNKVQTL